MVSRAMNMTISPMDKGDEYIEMVIVMAVISDIIFQDFSSSG